MFLLFVCVPPCFVKGSEGRKAHFGSFVAAVGRMVFLTFDVCTWEGDTEIVFGSCLSSVCLSDWHW